MALGTSPVAAAIAVTRFGLGAKPGEIAGAMHDPRDFLLSQIRGEGADQPSGPLKSSSEVVTNYADYLSHVRQDKQKLTFMAEADRLVALKAQKDSTYKDLRENGEWREILAREQLAVTTDAGFRERWTRFWSNHFTVSGVKAYYSFLTGPFEREAIRPNIFGRFEDLLEASAHHPAMLAYLDQTSSVGPTSPNGIGRGLNENVAREIMELHTVGVSSGYSQNDVTEFARALTGWSFSADLSGPDEPLFQFRPRNHEPGDRTIMGRAYRAAGESQARAVLHDLATHPATAQHIGRKIAIHFVSDTPPASLVSRLAESFDRSDGRLDEVAKTLVSSPEAWTSSPQKFKTPAEFMISSWRALNYLPKDLRDCIQPMQALGQRPMSAPSPKGWPEGADNWAAPVQLIKRIRIAEELARRATAPSDPVAVAQQALGAMLSPSTLAALSRAETRVQAISIMLMSPEFQRR